MNRGFTSMFADDLNHLIDLKISLGYSENTYLGRTRQFDRYCATKYAGTGDLTEWLLILSLKRSLSITPSAMMKSSNVFMVYDAPKIIPNYFP